MKIIAGKQLLMSLQIICQTREPVLRCHQELNQITKIIGSNFLI